jgi:polyisoprenyl-phosphate glycosyltransferase
LSAFNVPSAGDDMARPRYSAVVPVFRNEATLAALVDQLRSLAGRVGGPMEVVFVIDGSPDHSAHVLRELTPVRGLAVQIVEHSRNFGSFAAIRTGLAHARGRFIGVMSADLQEPVSMLEDFFAALDSGDVDVVVGVRTTRDDPWLSSVLSRAFWGMYRRAVVREIPPGGVDVFGCTPDVRDALLSMQESHTSLVAELYWVGYRRAEVPYLRRARAEGQGSWSLRKRLAYMQDSIFAFTAIPITVFTVLGYTGVALTLLASVVVAASWLVGAITVAGYTPLMLALLLTTSMLLVAVGIVGSYVWRTYENSKARPLAIVARHEAYDPG